MISVMRNRYVRALPRDGERVYPLDVGRAMRRSYSTDAHFVQYTSASSRRLSRAAMHAGEVATIAVIAIDIDCPDVHGSPAPAPKSWRDATLDTVRAIARDHGAPYYYATRGGARIIYRLPVPSYIASADDETAWSLDYLVTLAYLRRCYGLNGDVVCADWTRLFRLPRATRGASPERLETRGNPDRIAELHIAPTDADLAAAREQSRPRRAAHEFAAPNYSARPNSCDGAFVEALQARGDILGRREHAYVVRCPRERMHTSGRTGDGSTLLYPARAGATLGHIHCLHSHCAGTSLREWMAALDMRPKR